jgi:hypothetical protein
VGRWIETASRALLLFTIASVALVLALTFRIIELARADDEVGSHIARVLILLLAVTGALVARALLMSHASRHRVMVLALVGGLVLLMLLSAIVAYQLDDDRLNALELLWFVWPALAAYAITGPAPVRAALGPLTASPATPDRTPPEEPQETDTGVRSTAGPSTVDDAPTRHLEAPDDGHGGSM